MSDAHGCESAKSKTCQLNVIDVASEIARTSHALKQQIVALSPADMPLPVVRLQVDQKPRNERANSRTANPRKAPRHSHDHDAGCYVYAAHLIAATGDRFFTGSGSWGVHSTDKLSAEHVTPAALEVLAAAMDAPPLADASAIEINLDVVADCIRAANYLNFKLFSACIDKQSRALVDDSNFMQVLKAACEAGLHNTAQVCIERLIANIEWVDVTCVSDAIRLVSDLPAQNIMLAKFAESDAALSRLVAEEWLAEMHDCLGCSIFEHFWKVVCEQHFSGIDTLQQVFPWDATRCRKCADLLWKHEAKLQRDLLGRLRTRIQGSNTSAVYITDEESWEFVWKVQEVSKITEGSSKCSPRFTTQGVSSPCLDPKPYTWSLSTHVDDENSDYLGVQLGFHGGPPGVDQVQVSFHVYLVNDHDHNTLPDCDPMDFEDVWIDKDDYFWCEEVVKVSGNNALSLQDDCLTISVLISSIKAV